MRTIKAWSLSVTWDDGTTEDVSASATQDVNRAVNGFCDFLEEVRAEDIKPFYIICTMESGETVTWEDYAEDQKHAEGLAIAYAIEQTGEQVSHTYIEDLEEV